MSAPTLPRHPLAAVEHDHADLPTADRVRADGLGADDLARLVGRLSGHLAALERAVHPVALRRAPGTAPAVAELRALAHRLTVLLRLVERHSGGDVLLARTPRGGLVADLLAVADAHARCEHRLLDTLARTLTEAECAHLVERYRAALLAAPTRPHPYAPHRGRLGGLAYRIDALVDHVRDALDSRPAATPRPPRRLPEPGRWTRYLLGRGESPDA